MNLVLVFVALALVITAVALLAKVPFRNALLIGVVLAVAATACQHCIGTAQAQAPQAHEVAP